MQPRGIIKNEELKDYYITITDDKGKFKGFIGSNKIKDLLKKSSKYNTIGSIIFIRKYGGCPNERVWTI